MRRVQPVVIIVALSLLVNIYSLSRLNELQTQVNRLRNEVVYPNNLNRLESQLSNLSGQIARMETASRWVLSSSATPKAEVSSREHIFINVEWVLREVKQGAEVSLLYRPVNTESWQRIENISYDHNSFAAAIEVQPFTSYQYRIEERTKDYTQSSEVYYINEEMHSPQGYILLTNSRGPEKKQTYLGLTLFAAGYSMYDFYRIDEIAVNYYSAGVLTTSEVLAPIMPDEKHHFDKQLVIPSGVDTVKLEATFGDGTKLEETVWPGLDDGRNYEKRLFVRHTESTAYER